MVPADGSCNRGKLFDFRFYVAPAKSMPKRIRFTPSPDRLEAAEEALWALGAQSVTLLDAGDQPLLEPGPGETAVDVGGPAEHRVRIAGLEALR